MSSNSETARGAVVSDWVGPVASVTIEFRAGSFARFARFPGSAWRGAFGHALKRLVCVMHLRPCDGCPLVQACIFPQIFEPAVPPDAPILQHYRTAPTAYVLDPAETPRAGYYVAGEPVAVTLRLFGRIARLAPYAARALIEAAALGVGPDRIALAANLLRAGTAPAEEAWESFSFEAASAALRPMTLVPPPPPSGPFALSFATPLRLRVRNDLITPQRFRPAHLLGAAQRRISLLALFYGGNPPEFDHRALSAAGEKLQWNDISCHWVETTRRSARQQTAMQMGGILGRAVLDLGAVPGLWPFLWLGQWLHVGRSTTMGFGRYRIGAA